MTFIFRFISTVFKWIFLSLSFVRSLFFNLLFLALIAVIAFSFFHKEEFIIEDNSILKLSITGNIIEERNEADPFSDYFSEYFGLPEKPRETVLQDIIDTINQAQNDPKITALLLDLNSMGMIGLNQMQTIGSALNSFKQSGKPIISGEDYYSQNQYYLAAYSDKIFLNPMGGLNLNGFGLYRFYFKEALEKLKIDFQVFQVGSYKSATEPLTRNSMSPEDRGQSRSWLTAMWDNYVRDVASQRSISPEDINGYINKIPDNLKKVGGDVAKLALEYNLVDELKTRHEIRRYLTEITDSATEQDVNIVSFNNYLNFVTPSFESADTKKDQVALIIAQGTIMPGESKPGTIGADSISLMLRRVQNNENIKAVVLRIDSGGGSAFASEIIRQEILELKKSGKPVFVSMGTYAASGGYWISADADEIWASPSSLTGSIGIFMAFPTFDKMLSQGGIHRDGVGTTNLAAGIDLSQPIPTEISDAIQLTLDNGYQKFVSLVADGRGLTLEQVEQLAQGKVYDGAAAVNLGLVDTLGSLTETVEAAAERAGLDEYQVTTLSPPLSLRDRLLHSIGAETLAILAENKMVASLFKGVLPEVSELQRLLLFRDPNGMYAHCLTQYL